MPPTIRELFRRLLPLPPFGTAVDPEVETARNGLVDDSAAVWIFVLSLLLDALRIVRSWTPSVRAVALLRAEIFMLKSSALADKKKVLNM